MRILATYFKPDEEIHGEVSPLNKHIEEFNPDHILIYTEESLSIHTPTISELHMFEYSNVRYASWIVVEDILYRSENLPRYYIVAIPSNGRFECSETGYRGEFESSWDDVVGTVHSETNKIFREEISDRYQVIYIFNGGIIEHLIINIIASRLSTLKKLGIEVELMIVGLKDLGYVDIPIYDQAYHLVEYIQRNVERIDSLYLSLPLLHQIISIYKKEELEMILDLVEEEISRIEAEYYMNIYSDREGYILKVVRNKHLPQILIPLDELRLILTHLTRNEKVDIDKLSKTSQKIVKLLGMYLEKGNLDKVVKSLEFRKMARDN